MTDFSQETAPEALARMTRVLAGKTPWRTYTDAGLGISNIVMADGPHGLRKEIMQPGKMQIGFNPSAPAVCYPTASALACSFNIKLLNTVGAALGEECREANVNVLLGPGLNMKRSPLCGRNFEYFSEDPVLAGKLGAAYISGLQSTGVGACVKHFACNSQEYARFTSDSIVDERALNEQYLRAFEIAIGEARPWMVMAAYNKLNGVHATQNPSLLTGKLRDEWGFDGAVVTDWGALEKSVDSLNAGLDLVMPGPLPSYSERIAAGVESGEVAVETLEAALDHLRTLSNRCDEGRTVYYHSDAEDHLLLAHDAALESAVLLENDGVLPLSTTAHVAFIGEFAKQPRYQGAGSSKINPIELDSAWDAARAQRLDVEFASGYDLATGETSEELLEQATELAGRCDVAVVFAGLPESYESEGFDRADMRLPEGHEQLIARVAAVNNNTVVVLSCGAPVECTWAPEVSALLVTYLSGCQSGLATVDLLFGMANPSGKLAETWPAFLSDTPLGSAFPVKERQVPYLESIFTGYRYYDAAKVKPRYPFGYGLSYTAFEYENISLRQHGPGYRIELDVANIGRRRGKESVQVYVHAKNPAVFRPEQELVAFGKVQVDPGESEHMVLDLDETAFRYWDDDTHRWRIDEGEYEIRIAASSRDAKHAESLTMTVGDAPFEVEKKAYTDEFEREQLDSYFNVRPNGFNRIDFEALYNEPLPFEPPLYPFTPDSQIADLRQTKLGRFALKQIRKRAENAPADEGAASKQMVQEMLETMPLRAMTLGGFSLDSVDALCDILNGNRMSGLIEFFKSRPR